MYSGCLRLERFKAAGVHWYETVLMETPRARGLALLACGLLAAPIAAQLGTSAQVWADMPSLRGSVAIVRYVPGYLDRASHVLRRVDLVASDLTKRGRKPFPVIVLVVPRELWEGVSLGRPYGLPVTVSGMTIVVPAEGDQAVAEQWKQWLGSDLPKLRGRPLRGTPEGASALAIADLFLQREIAGLFAFRQGLVGADPWIQGVLSHLVALVIFDRYETSRMQEIELVYQRLESQIPLRLDLLGEEASARPVESWLHSQAEYFATALSIYRAHGSKALQRVLKEARKGDGNLDSRRLVRLIPELSKWLAVR